MSDPGVPKELIEPLTRCAEGRAPPNVALMQLFLAAGEEDVRHALKQAIAIAEERREAAQAARLVAIQRLWDAAPNAYSTISAIRDLMKGGGQIDPETVIPQFAAFFDRAAEISPEASVALYSLGDALLLDETTQEILNVMREWKLFGPESRVLDSGCGTGRVLETMAPMVAAITGVDISETMLAVARAKIARFHNASAVRGSGRDLSAVLPGPFDLVLAIDSFPYLVEARVAESHVRDCARLLRPQGHLLIMNYSYRCNDSADRADIARLAGQFGFSILRNGTRDLHLWDGIAFLLQKRIRSQTPEVAPRSERENGV